MLTSTALVLLMTIPGLALFYGGLVRSKNILSTLMHSFFCAVIVSVLWFIVGYSIAFGPTQGGLWGGLSLMFLRDLSQPASLAPTIPHALFVMYQLTFAIITPALISGAFAERFRFAPFAAFSALWSLIVYAPLAHWVWGGGWIATTFGALDFAGGTVVHISSGVSALVCALYLGKRHGYGHEPMPPHNLPFTVVGAGMLWVGWFGFNAGSALSAGSLASTAMLNTHLAAATAGVGWMLVELTRSRHATVLGVVSGAVAGLVAITPAAGFVTPTGAAIIGLIGGGVCYLAVSFKPKLGYDDALDVVGVHFVGGTIGALLTGVFATALVNPAIKDLALGTPGGVIDGHWKLVWQQAAAVGVTIVFAGVATLGILMVVNLIWPLRASPNEETLGMDLSQHRERAYVLSGGEAVAAAAAVMAEPRAADAPPASIQRFTIVLDHVSEQQVERRWRELCRRISVDGNAVSTLTLTPTPITVRGTRFRFLTDGQHTPENVRTQLESLFSDLNAKARIETQG
ncbi:MAG: ammonium transporter [Phycisphaerales bacterium]|nr:ammonium transporter [Phycisphaerales bacterium]